MERTHRALRHDHPRSRQRRRHLSHPACARRLPQGPPQRGAAAGRDLRGGAGGGARGRRGSGDGGRPMSAASSTKQRVTVEVADHVAVVTLTRPDKHNALDIAMFDQINAAADRVAAEPGVRAVVLHGAGPSFCSGLDVVSIMAAGNGLDGLVERVRGGGPNWFQRAAYAWLELPMPVIAAVHGTCFGGGLQIALGADPRIAAPATRRSGMEGKWGLVPEL